MKTSSSYNLYIGRVTLTGYNEPTWIERVLLFVAASREDAQEKARARVAREFPAPDWIVFDPDTKIVDRELAEHAARAVLYWAPAVAERPE